MGVTKHKVYWHTTYCVLATLLPLLTWARRKRGTHYGQHISGGSALSKVMAWRARQLRVLTRTLRTQARYDHVPRDDLGEPSYIRPAGVATPRQVHTQFISSLEGPNLD